MPLAAVITGAGMFAMATVNSGWQMVLIFALIGFVGIGGGQSLLNTVPVAKWFVHQRATATALVIMGIPIGILILAPVTEAFVSAYGWRTAWTMLGIIGIAITVPTSLLLIRREPADMGLHPDGNTVTHSVDGIDGKERGETLYVDDEVSWTRSEAIHSSTFWRLVAVFSVLTLAQSTLSLHRIPNFVDRGIDPTLISYALSAESVAAIITSLVLGPILGRYQTRYVGGMLRLSNGGLHGAEYHGEQRFRPLFCVHNFRIRHPRSRRPAALHLGGVLREGTPGQHPWHHATGNAALFRHRPTGRRLYP